MLTQTGPLHNIFLLIGGNLGDRQQNLHLVRKMIAERVGTIEKASSIFQTAAWGMENQPDFLNQALQVATPLGPLNLLDALLAIERDMGRIRNEKYGPRTVDIDILLYNDLSLDHPDLLIPHPRMAQRRFVLEPLAEIAGDFIHPVQRISINKMLDNCSDSLDVKKIG